MADHAFHSHSTTRGKSIMYNIFYIIGVVVVVLAILSFVGLA